ncbi:psaP-like photosystem I subunit [Klebsormidium nitens]|uniref:PsaP-like photosystem I subunit n=1 Tax=Klebsormidium nitens TaxID=105231 RepID=A0A1Y1HNZ3_KLENI|nr:psaP-like photosystem I subunit [Klebsormidium nitens]|eukprot:GAQ79492.1 psaP-like photosystem I subunit [Klebsormidium nitens]
MASACIASSAVSSFVALTAPSSLRTEAPAGVPALPVRGSCAGSSFNGRSLRLAKAVSGARYPSRTKISAKQVEDPVESIDAQTEDLLKDLQEKWDKVENKSSVYLYGGGALVALWLSSTIVGAINSVPLLPKFAELIGLGYTGWFVYRYLLFKSSRKELLSDIEELKGKITGAKDEVL